MEHTFLECPYPFYYFFQNKWVHVLSCIEIHALKQQGAGHHCDLKSKRNMMPIAAHNSRDHAVYSIHFSSLHLFPPKYEAAFEATEQVSGLLRLGKEFPLLFLKSSPTHTFYISWLLSELVYNSILFMHNTILAMGRAIFGKRVC